jgi:MucBP domain.
MKKNIIKSKSVVLFSATTLLMGGIVTTDSINLLNTSKIYAASSRTVSVQPVDFLKYFQRNGSAANFSYNLSNFVQTLTPDQQSQVGNITLINKVDMSQNFVFKGEINLGNKSTNPQGADGIGILFHPGDTNVVGGKGGAAGIGGVPGAFGFKLDTFYNSAGESGLFQPDPNMGGAFGAFVNGTTGTAITDTSTAKLITKPQNNQFLPIEIDYNGSNHIMTVNYNGTIFTKDISSLLGSNTAMSFSISASTGFYTNLQQLKNISFNYTIAQGNVISKYVDDQGNEISESTSTSGDLDTLYSTAQKTIPGYTFNKIDPTGALATGKFTANDQTVTYVYTKNAPTVTTETKTVNENIDYVFANGDKAADSHTAAVKFTRQVSTDAVTGEKSYGDWSADQSFDAVKSPDLKGYTPDKDQIDKQVVKGSSDDLSFKVIYTKNAPTVTTKNVHNNGSLVSQSKEQQTLPNSMELPNTGVDKTESITIAGVMMLILTIILGMIFTSKKHKND